MPQRRAIYHSTVIMVLVTLAAAPAVAQDADAREAAYQQRFAVMPPAVQAELQKLDALQLSALALNHDSPARTQSDIEACIVSNTSIAAKKDAYRYMMSAIAQARMMAFKSPVTQDILRTAQDAGMTRDVLVGHLEHLTETHIKKVQAEAAATASMNNYSEADCAVLGKAVNAEYIKIEKTLPVDSKKRSDAYDEARNKLAPEQQARLDALDRILLRTATPELMAIDMSAKVRHCTATRAAGFADSAALAAAFARWQEAADKKRDALAAQYGAEADKIDFLQPGLLAAHARMQAEAVTMLGGRMLEDAERAGGLAATDCAALLQQLQKQELGREEDYTLAALKARIK